MSDASWFRNSALAGAIFTPVPGGQLFRRFRILPFGLTREYRLTDAQADRLVADYGRAHARCVLGVLSAIVTCLIVAGASVALGLDAVMAARPLACFAVILLLTIGLIVLAYRIFDRISCRSLEGLPYVTVPRPEQNLQQRLAALTAIEAMMPTWMQVGFLGLFAVLLVQSGMRHDTANAVIYLLFMIVLGIGLFIKLRAIRARKSGE